jgi:hypothetical protein
VFDLANWKRYGKNELSLTGFEELAEALNKAGKNVDVEGRKCFEKCAENVYDALEAKAREAGLAENLIEKIDEIITEKHGLWAYYVGWKKTRYNPRNLSPWAKVAFFNYGTPMRKTKSGQNRGQETAHPEGTHGFIKKAKLAARQKNKKLQKDTLTRIAKGI